MSTGDHNSCEHLRGVAAAWGKQQQVSSSTAQLFARLFCGHDRASGRIKIKQERFPQKIRNSGASEFLDLCCAIVRMLRASYDEMICY